MPIYIVSTILSLKDWHTQHWTGNTVLLLSVRRHEGSQPMLPERAGCFLEGWSSIPASLVL
jgi:hypothetical protein